MHGHGSVSGHHCDVFGEPGSAVSAREERRKRAEERRERAEERRERAEERRERAEERRERAEERKERRPDLDVEGDVWIAVGGTLNRNADRAVSGVSRDVAEVQYGTSVLLILRTHLEYRAV